MTRADRGHHRHRRRLRGRGYFRGLGPGIVTGAADDDPSGIGTYVQVGARFGTGLVWFMPFLLPFAAGVQETAARLGLTTGRGLAAVVRERRGRTMLWTMVVLVAGANTLNIAADLASMGAALHLIVPVPATVTIVVLAAAIIGLDVALPYRRSQLILRWLALSLLAYPLVLVVVSVPWVDTLRDTFRPQLRWDRAQIAALIAIFGTTVSPYLYFWQAGEEMEEDAGHADVDPTHVRRMRIDVIAGMTSAIIAAWAMIVVGASTLHVGGINTVGTAEDAAAALEPLAGNLAGLVFASGIVGLGLLAIPVLAGSTGYAVAEAAGWSEGLSQRFRSARGFYGTIAASVIVGLVISLSGIDPMHGLFLAAVGNGLAAPPLLAIMLVVARDESLLGPWRSRGASTALVGGAILISTSLPLIWLAVR